MHFFGHFDAMAERIQIIHQPAAHTDGIVTEYFDRFPGRTRRNGSL